MILGVNRLQDSLNFLYTVGCPKIATRIRACAYLWWDFDLKSLRMRGFSSRFLDKRPKIRCSCPRCFRRSHPPTLPPSYFHTHGKLPGKSTVLVLCCLSCVCPYVCLFVLALLYVRLFEGVTVSGAWHPLPPSVMCVKCGCMFVDRCRPMARTLLYDLHSAEAMC